MAAQTQHEPCACTDAATLSVIRKLLVSECTPTNVEQRMTADTESALLTVAEAAKAFNRSPSAIRHLIFQAESTQASSAGGLKGFRDCIVRPFGQRRVFIHKNRLQALIDGRTL